MRFLTLSLESKRLFKQLQFYNECDFVGVTLVTFKDGKEAKREQLGKIIDKQTIELLKHIAQNKPHATIDTTGRF